MFNVSPGARRKSSCRRRWSTVGLRLALCAGAGMLAFSGCGRRWQRYSSAAGRFSVLVPGIPRYSEEALRPAGVPLVLHKYQVIFEEKAVGYCVMYADFPQKLAHSVKPSRLLDFGERGASKIPRSRLVDRRNILLDGYPGREITVLDANGLVYRNRFYMVDRRLYQVIAASPKQEAASPDVRRFLGSFQLLQK